MWWLLDLKYAFWATCFGAILLCRRLEKRFSMLMVRTTALLKFDVLTWGGWRGERWHGNKHLRRDDAWQCDNIPHFCVFFCGVILFFSPTVIPNGQKMLYYYLVKFHIDLIICLFLSLGWHYQLNDHVLHALFEKRTWLNQVSVCMEGTIIFPFCCSTFVQKYNTSCLELNI